MIWQRYLLKEYIKVFSLVLFGFFFIYLALDYSSHMQDFLKSKQLHFRDFIFYYGTLFIKRSDLLIPLGLLIASIKVLTTLNSHRELLALQVAGLNFKKLTKPFFLVAACCTLFNLFSTEFILPQSLSYLDNFHNHHFKDTNRSHRVFVKKEKLHVIALKDRSKAIYQYFDKEKEAYFDLIWIRTPDDLWRIKYLQTEGSYPIGHYADHFIRNKEGFFEKESSYIQKTFTDLPWAEKSLDTSFTPYENRKVSELWRIAQRSTTTAYEKIEIMTHFYFKIVMPFLPLLVVIASTPFCICYSRTQLMFFIYAFALFGFITFYLLMNASVILGENNLFPPLIAICAPFTICTLCFSWKFIKTT